MVEFALNRPHSFSTPIRDAVRRAREIVHPHRDFHLERREFIKATASAASTAAVAGPLRLAASAIFLAEACGSTSGSDSAARADLTDQGDTIPHLDVPTATLEQLNNPMMLTRYYSSSTTKPPNQAWVRVRDVAIRVDTRTPDQNHPNDATHAISTITVFPDYVARDHVPNPDGETHISVIDNPTLNESHRAVLAALALEQGQPIPVKELWVFVDKINQQGAASADNLKIVLAATKK